MGLLYNFPLPIKIMTIQIRLFAILRERAGVSEFKIECPEGSLVSHAVAQIQQRFPIIAAYCNRAAYAVNCSYAQANTILHDGDELALIPPVSGGVDDDWIDILPDPLDTAAALRFVTTESAGGIDLFLGTTRSDQDSAGRQLVALDYEAYMDMAKQQLQNLARQARQDWPIERLVLLHRIGRVGLGEPSVLIAVASPHRAEAFAACRWLIDTLKKEAAIWKKEIWTTGPATWSGTQPP